MNTGIEHYATFILSSLFFSILPGIDTLFILSRSIIQGKKAGIYATLGINTGILIHATFVTLGLSLIIAHSPIAFSIIKYAGAAYIIYLGISKFCQRKPIISEMNNEQMDISRHRDSYLAGILTNLLNPKVILFFLAFFPQFVISPEIESHLPFVILSITYLSINICWTLALSIFFASFSSRLISNTTISKWINKITGTIFLLLGVLTGLDII
ncbi:MAG: Homoserine/homoserine lactone efflux protein [Parabacteroides sp.]|jgi:lysE family membrane transporter